MPNLEHVDIDLCCYFSGQVFKKIGQFQQLIYFRIERGRDNASLIEQCEDIHFGGGTLPKLEFLDVDPSNSNRPVGILTKTDLVRESLKSYKNIDLPAESVMSKNLTFAKDYLEEEQVAEAMRSNNIHYVLVEDEQSNWIGMASTVDILEEMAHSNKAFPYNRRRKVEY
ncbi:hypothetical protein C9374_010698 [Naegleria lovaniensis]|uniref:CBS domain-containing protein n=1 Tax=Naegleria lovaniensis TaxID=51637 RepID=A0AA88GGZ6_NAELO|nr:uncharacterized protein C9374_010698 [Naegleria lovaniensis]KAG2374414.1 hypothetical protein C9374_010698 [Naegleria lovaniensis]